MMVTLHLERDHTKEVVNYVHGLLFLSDPVCNNEFFIRQRIGKTSLVLVGLFHLI